MNILAIDSTTDTFSCGIFSEGRIIAENYTVNPKKQLANLAVSIKRVLDSVPGIKIDLVAVCKGPGSFTGIRIAHAAAKTIAQVLDVPIASVNTLDAIAANFDPKLLSMTACSLIAALDARKNEVFYAKYTSDGEKLVRQSDYMAVLSDDFASKLSECDNVIVCASAVKKYFNKLKNAAEGKNITLYENKYAFPTPLSIASCAEKLPEAKYSSCLENFAVYMRRSQAEEEREKNVTFSLMTKDDLKGVAEIERLCFKDSWNEELLKKELENEKIALYAVAKNHDNMIGYMGGWVILEEVQIVRIAVTPVWRNRKIAEKLMEFFFDEARKRGGEWVTLEVNEHNIPAQKLYEHFGFKQINTRKQYYDNKDDAFLLWKKF